MAVPTLENVIAELQARISNLERYISIDKASADAAYAPIAKGVTNGDTHDHSGGDGAQINHTTLSNIGTLSHATIDTYLNQAVKTSSIPSFPGIKIDGDDRAYIQVIGDYQLLTTGVATIFDAPSGSPYSYIAGMFLASGGADSGRVTSVSAQITWTFHNGSNIGYAQVIHIAQPVAQKGWGAGSGNLTFAVTGNGTNHLGLTITNSADYTTDFTLFFMGLRRGI